MLRFCSRQRGWITDDPRLTYRYYSSPSIQLSPEEAARWTGRTGAQICRNKAGGAAPAALLRLARIFDTWYLYPDTISIGCGPEHYV